MSAAVTVLFAKWTRMIPTSSILKARTAQSTGATCVLVNAEPSAQRRRAVGEVVVDAEAVRLLRRRRTRAVKVARAVVKRHRRHAVVAGAAARRLIVSIGTRHLFCPLPIHASFTQRAI